MVTLIAGILVLCALMILLMPRPQPTVVYVEREPEPKSTVGCLPVAIVLGIAVLVALRVI